jgi:ubiquinone/menaquinone biosynthesis C-methylase UbiE
MMAQPSRFWDRHAEGYAKRPVSDQAAYEKKLKATQDYLKPDMGVLELACGTGTTALIHAPFVKHIHAIDISGKMLDIANAKATTGNIENVTFEQSSIEELNAGDDSYDAVMAHSILHLLGDRQDAIRKVHRLLKPGGLFISSTVCLTGAWLFLKPVLSIGRFLGMLPLVNFLTAEELCRDMTEAGFQIEHQWQPGKGKAVFLMATKA